MMQKLTSGKTRGNAANPKKAKGQGEGERKTDAINQRSHRSALSTVLSLNYSVLSTQYSSLTACQLSLVYGTVTVNGFQLIRSSVCPRRAFNSAGSAPGVFNRVSGASAYGLLKFWAISGRRTRSFIIHQQSNPIPESP
jgi:hypothetical protein